MDTISHQPAAPDATVESRSQSLRARIKGRPAGHTSGGEPDWVEAGEGNDQMSTCDSSGSRDIVVGFADAASSSEALEQAIAEARADDAVRLVVVHASSSPIAVRNGPPPAVARAMGEPVWSTVHATVLEAGAVPERTLTIVEPGEPLSVLARHAAGASVVYLGPSRRRMRRRSGLGHRLGARIDCPVIQVADPAVATDRSHSRSQVRRPERSPALQPGVTS